MKFEPRPNGDAEVASFTRKRDEWLDSIKDPVRQARLKAQQWRLDQELDKHKNPIVRYNKMVELFWEGVKKFQATIGTS